MPLSETTTNNSTGGTSHDTETWLDSVLDEWRALIDEMKEQVDLATRDLRDDLRMHLDVLGNVDVAIRSRLTNARHDTADDLADVRQGLDQLLLDLRRTYNEAEAILQRGHSA